jgi:nucleoside-diphosphate-sugar epimerase
MIKNKYKIFVTGVAGMIGSNVARNLINNGHCVVGVDNFWRGKKSNIEDLLNNESFFFRHADIISDQEWFQDMSNCDELIHIADVVAGIGYVFSNEWNVFQKNLLINTSIARIVSIHKPKFFLYLGTACSYPQGLQRSVDSSELSENDKFPADPESGYGWSKLLGEIEFRLVTKNLPTKFITLDLHNVYGWPCVYKDQTAQVIPSLIYKALRSTDGKLHVWGDGNQGRAFLHVSDVVSAIDLARDYQGNFSTFMIGPDSCTLIRKVAEAIQTNDLTNIAEIVFDKSKPTGDVGRFADSTLAKNELKWEPSIDFNVGLNDLIKKISEDEKK